MPQKGPHISIAPDFVVNRILRINLEDFEEWPEAVRRLAIQIAEELFLVSYNPFIDAQMVKNSVSERFNRESFALAQHYATSIGEGITMFWSAHEAEQNFRQELIRRLKELLPHECILTSPAALVECATDATDLRMELPILVVEPQNANQVSAVVRLANEMKFALIPRGGASGYTGGAVPARKRSVIVSMTQCNHISEVDTENAIIHAGAGAITQHVIDIADESKFIFSVDPASKTASSIGGNVAENSGGPFAFEYGTTLDNLLSWRMVTPTGEIITIERKNHPRHKIMPNETAVFEVKDPSGGIRNTISLRGDEIRLPNLGKDVTNKVLGGLPGVQKEGIDGIIVDASFILHKKPALSKVAVLEFFGRSMHGAAVVIKQMIGLRDKIRDEGDYAHISALEEFNKKYVQAIDYQTRSEKFKDLPISVIILQFDADEEAFLDKCMNEMQEIIKGRDDVDLIIAKDRKQAEVFWEDRHKLSAIAKRTSGFKINEDIVIPTDKIPDLALFLEQLNLECAGAAYRHALQAIGRLPQMPLENKDLNREFSYATKVAKGDVLGSEVSDAEMMERACSWIDNLIEAHPELENKINKIKTDMLNGLVIVASHMHAGDGNCHVNIPVNSNDLHMLETAEDAAMKVMAKAKEMGGAVSGEHGIGITKIMFMPKEQLNEVRKFKEGVDPRDILNPAKLVQNEMPVKPFTFSFNRLIEDINQSGLPNKEVLMNLLASVQICTRCGKCKFVCPMVYPKRSFHYHPRNRNIILGAMIEAIYYTQINKGKPDPALLADLNTMLEHCTSCGKCSTVCPVKIPSDNVALELRAFLENEGAGVHPVKTKVIDYISKKPELRLQKMAKLASAGQKFQNNAIKFIPKSWRGKLNNPLFADQGPQTSYNNLYESLSLEKGGIFVPEGKEIKKAVLYFPGCGGALFSRHIAIATLGILLKCDVAVVIPEHHMCCGYPLLSSGMNNVFTTNMAKNLVIFKNCLENAKNAGFEINTMVTACGSCYDGLKRYGLEELGITEYVEATRFACQNLAELPEQAEDFKEKYFIYHASCHMEVPSEHKVKGAGRQCMALEAYTGAKVLATRGCCGESGLGAITAPKVFNVMRERKKEDLNKIMVDYPNNRPILVGCPSCKFGIMRSLMDMHKTNNVRHTIEWLAELCFKPKWSIRYARILQKALAKNPDEKGIRHIDLS